MTDRQFAQKRPGLSWHVIDFHTRGLNTWKALCGRLVIDPVSDTLPSGKSCETCLRIAGKAWDEEAAANDEVPADA
jgi:hypothetical protein